MSLTRLLLLVLAGLGAGLTGSVAGLASLISYPVLLLIGLPPVAANVTNTVSLVSSSLGSTLGSRTELAGQGPLVRVLGVAAVAGGLLGGGLLLLTPPHAFERVVPWLIAGGSLAVLLPRSGQLPQPGRAHRGQVPGVFTIAVYGGYFGAAAGVVMLALLLHTTRATLPQTNALKNVLMGLANAVAAVGFAVAGPVRWLPAVPLALGLFVGGRLGPAVVRRTPSGLLRKLIAVAGLALAARLAGTAYS